MHKTLKRKFDLRLVRFFVAFGVLVLPSVFLYAEDFTTLDGKTFTNITEVAKYPNLVVFTYNENRTSVAISNLPAEFRVKHGVKETESESAPQAVPLQTNSTDTILSVNRNSNLVVQRDIQEDMANRAIWHSWTMLLTARDVQLSSYTFCKIDSNVKSAGSVFMRFQLGEEALARQVFDKFTEWERIASKNNSESFEKVIPGNNDPNGAVPIADKTRIFTFKWDREGKAEGKLELGVGTDIRASLIDSAKEGFTTDNAHKSDILGFRELLKLIPDMKRELAQKIRAQEAQQNLFK